MTRAVILGAVVLAAGLARADGPLGGEAKSGGTNRVVTSKIMTERGWRRDIVTVDEQGQIHNDGGKIAQTAETEAINEVADSAGEIADAAQASMTDSMDVLYSKTNHMATAGLGIALVFAPETDDINVRGFVVKTETEGRSTDVQWVWYNNALSLAPNRFVTYETYDKAEKVKVNWGKWDAAGTNLTVNGRVWSGCHRCTVTRPSWAVGKSCLDCPNETWGGENGMEWGDLTLTHGDIPYFTGYVTNSVDGLVAYFDNGFLKEISSITP